MIHKYKIPYTRRDLYKSRINQNASQSIDEHGATQVEEKRSYTTDSNCNKEDGLNDDGMKCNTASWFDTKKDEGHILLENAKTHTELSSTHLDYVDYIPNTDRFTSFDIVIYLFSLCSYLADVGTDIWVAYMYFHQGHVIWFSLTVLLIVIPAITVTLFSLAWYLQDHKHSKNSLGEQADISRVQWTSRTVCLLLQIGLAIRYIECLLYGVRSKKDRQWYSLLAFEDTDSTLLRLLECFLEATPQLTLQLYIMLTLGLHDGWFMVVVQVLSCVTSLGSVCWGLVSYHRALRYSLSNKANITYGGMALQFFWRLFTISSRVLALAMFAAAYKYWTFVAVTSHWIVMFIWILSQRTKFCDTKCKEFFFNVVMATVYIFCYVNLLEGHTRLRYIFFYTIMYLENMALTVAWYAVAGTSSDWYILPAMVAVFTCPCIGLIFMLLYYRFCHPNNLSSEFSHVKIKICVTWSNIYLCQVPAENKTDLVSHVQSHELQNRDGLNVSHV